ncbi:MAG: YicC family protein [Planctomycetales bacterium]|nr:YicC family protein [Planctomycetales bacterium]
MLLSMTGQGLGRHAIGPWQVSVELRAVNNRHLKIQLRMSDGLQGLEQQVEARLRMRLRRGSLQVGVYLSGDIGNSRGQLQADVIKNYWHQLQVVAEDVGARDALSFRDVLLLPGVIDEGKRLSSESEFEPELVSAVETAVNSAIDQLNQMRRAEGDSMASELNRQLARLEELTCTIEGRAPAVVDDYRRRLQQRLAMVLSDMNVQIGEPDLLREITLFADKSDIREELVRLRSHFGQFQNLINDAESQGRKLDFLIQEIFRECNTIGAKASDSEIAQRVVDLKTIVEQMRELVQNVE